MSCAHELIKSVVQPEAHAVIVTDVRKVPMHVLVFDAKKSDAFKARLCVSGDKQSLFDYFSSIFT